jgi:hypothetical protein
MIPEEPAPGASPTHASSDVSADAASPTSAGRTSRGRSALTVLAAVSAAVGFLALAAILLTALLGRDVWPGFVLLTYVCLPLSFLLMAALVVGSFVSRRRG